jgi:hypothetical protein
MNYIFTNAPFQIYRVLQFIEDHPGDYTIICPSEMAPFFRKFTDTYVVVPWVIANLFDRKNLWNLPLNLARLWRNWHTYFSKVRGQNIHVFFTSWSLSYFWFIRKLEKHNVVHYWLPEENYPFRNQFFPLQKDLISAVMRWFARLVLGLDLDVMDKSVPAYELKRSGLMQHLHEVDRMSVYKKLMKDSSLVKDMDVLFLSENVTTEGADLRSVEIISNQVKTMLDTLFGDRWCLKGHPREPDVYGNFEYAQHVLSRYILVEVLYGHPWKVVMSYYSEALITAKELTDAKCISLMELFEWGNKELKKYWRDRFKRFGVLCPRNVKELKEMLK